MRFSKNAPKRHSFFCFFGVRFLGAVFEAARRPKTDTGLNGDQYFDLATLQFGYFLGYFSKKSSLNWFLANFLEL